MPLRPRRGRESRRDGHDRGSSGREGIPEGNLSTSSDHENRWWIKTQEPPPVLCWHGLSHAPPQHHWSVLGNKAIYAEYVGYGIRSCGEGDNQAVGSGASFDTATFA